MLKESFVVAVSFGVWEKQSGEGLSLNEKREVENGLEVVYVMGSEWW